MVRIMLDNSIYSALSKPENFSYIRMLNDLIDAGKVQNLITHIQIDEMEGIKEPTQKARVNAISRTFIPTSGFVLGYSRLGMARLGGGTPALKYEDVRKTSKRIVKDSLVSITAASDADIFVTEDKIQAKRFKRNRKNIPVYDFSMFITFLETEHKKLR